jgi:hypothetical protein
MALLAISLLDTKTLAYCDPLLVFTFYVFPSSSSMSSRRSCLRTTYGGTAPMIFFAKGAILWRATARCKMSAERLSQGQRFLIEHCFHWIHCQTNKRYGASVSGSAGTQDGNGDDGVFIVEETDSIESINLSIFITSIWLLLVRVQ